LPLDHRTDEGEEGADRRIRRPRTRHRQPTHPARAAGGRAEFGDHPRRRPRSGPGPGRCPRRDRSDPATTHVFVETDAGGQVTLTSAEAVTFARIHATELLSLLPDGGASNAGNPEAVVVGDLSEDAVAELGRLGVETIHHLEHPELEEYSAA